VLLVDTNVVAYLLVEGEKTGQARGVWEGDRDWCAPRLLLYELANVFWRLVDQKALSPEAGQAGLESGLALVRLLDRDPEPARVLEIALKLGVSAYDAFYLAAAEMMQVPLVTEDGRLLRVAPALARPLDFFHPSAPLY
jgi:predicted nucleic acid-binding protein